MDLNGCGCPGFSLTEKYRDAIINIYDNIGKLKFESYQYKDFQEIISKNGISKESEIRMIVPFFRKAKIISQNSYQLNGDRICKLTISSNFFTQAGHIFITLLKLNKNNKELNNQSIKDVIERLYENICFLIFIYRYKSS